MLAAAQQTPTRPAFFASSVVLELLAHAKEPMSTPDVCREAGYSRETMRQAIKQLCELSLIEPVKSEDPDGQRPGFGHPLVFYRITPDGRVEFEKRLQLMREGRGREVEPFTSRGYPRRKLPRFSLDMAMLDFIGQHGRMQASAIRRRFGCSRQLVWEIMLRLEALGLVIVDRSEQPHWYSVSEELLEAKR